MICLLLSEKVSKRKKHEKKFLEDLKVPELKSFVKSLKLTGYNKLRKNDLLALIRESFEKKKHEKKFLEDLKVPELKSFSKSLKLTGYSKLRKNDLLALIRESFEKKKHKKKFLRREERKKDKKEFKRIEAEKREKIKTEKEQKKEERREKEREERREEKREKKQKQNEKKQKERRQVKEFREKTKEKAEEKKRVLRKLQEKELVETDSALKNFAKQFTVDGEPGFDPKSFFNAIKQSLLKILRENRGVKAKIILNCLMKRIDLKTGEETKVEAAFHSGVKTNLLGTNEKKLLNVMFEEVLENMAQFQRRGSNWRFVEVLKLEIHLVSFVPLKGNSWIPLPETISKKKAVINMKNEDNECFKWCVTRVLNPVEHHPERITQDLWRQSEELRWKGIEFPMKIDQIDKFERMNERISINVFYYDRGVFPLRIPEVEKEHQIDLLLITSGGDEDNEEKKHYCLIKNLSRLLSSQVTKHEKHLVFCRRCLNHLPNEEKLNIHKEYCSQKDSVKIVMPKEGKNILFRNQNRMMKLPIVVYADFEAFLENIDSCEPNSRSSFTEKYQMHKPCGFCFKIVFSEDIEKIVPKCFTKPFLYRTGNEKEDVAQIFVDRLEKDIQKVYQFFGKPKNMVYTRDDKNSFIRSTKCWICKKDFETGKKVNRDYVKVRDHCHFTGKFRGAAHSKCNLKYKNPKFTPIFFHNQKGYDSHLFVKNLGKSEGIITCIANNEEKYISFSKHIQVGTYTIIVKKEGKNVEEEKPIYNELRFLDSAGFMKSSLASLVKNLAANPEKLIHTKSTFRDKTALVSRKSIYPYDLMNSFEKFSERDNFPRKINSLTN